MKKHFTLILLAFTTGFTFSQSNKCLDFDGIDDYVLMGDVNDLGTSDFTLEAWINIESTAGNGNKIISKGITSVGSPTNAGYSLRAGKYTADGIDFSIGDKNGSVTTLKYSGVQTNKWYHIAGVRSQTNLYLYVNGQLVNSDATQNVYDVDTDMPLAVGAIHKGGFSPTNEYFNGKIDEVRIWNKALTRHEINSNNACAIFTPEPNLIAVYNFNETSGTNADDVTVGQNDGLLANGPVWVSSDVALLCLISSADITKSFIKVYPNPFQSELTVENTKNDASYRIFDISGKLVASGILNDHKIQTANLSNGSYVLEVIDGAQVHRAKIVRK